jgi:hypothetical protein
MMLANKNNRKKTEKKFRKQQKTLSLLIYPKSKATKKNENPSNI